MFGRFLSISLFLMLCAVAAFAQFTRFENIKPMISTREDVEKLYGKGEEKWAGWVWYYFDDENLSVVYGDGKCRGFSWTPYNWLAPKDTVIIVDVNFLKDRKLSDLKKKKAKLKKLKFTHAYDTPAGSYADDENGVSFYVSFDVKEWNSITYYPSAKYSQTLCKD
jgi:hypothetical protein